MRIFEIRHDEDNREWCTGETLLHALVNYLSATETLLCDIDEAEMFEIPKENWANYTIKSDPYEEESDDNGDEKCPTFVDWIKENDKYPKMINGRVYD